MIIKPQQRILTVGDGDLSFSHALWQHHQPALLCASVLDSEQQLNDKYQQHQLYELKEAGCQVLTGFDVTNPKSWGDLPTQQFDLVIFQFPLLPAFDDQQDFLRQCEGISVNTLNRKLLRQYLIHCQQYFLDSQGEQLCYITSKDVKPYREWNIEQSIHQKTNLHYLGSSLFDIANFPGYRVRNVDRDKHVKDTQGITYVWSPQADHAIRAQLKAAEFVGENYCTPCRAGPFGNQQQRDDHMASRKHKLMTEYEQQWKSLLTRVKYHHQID